MEKNSILFVLLAFAFGVLVTFIFINGSGQQKVEQNGTVLDIVENVSNKTEGMEEHITGKTFSELKNMNKKLVCDVDGQVKLHIWGNRFKTENKDDGCGVYTTIYKQTELYVQCQNEFENATECEWIRIDTQETNDLHEKNAERTRIEEQFDKVPPESFDCIEKDFDVSVFDTPGKVCDRSDLQTE